ncbi:MAG TPA: EF-hand domain-containing protein [Sphingomicrobium sp.]
MAFELLIPLLALAVGPTSAQSDKIVITGRDRAPFISPMGEPFRARSADDDMLARWFYQADRDRDGTLTPDEMQADADRFFASLDANRDGQIDPEELMAYEAEIAPEIQVNTRWMRAPATSASATQSPAQTGTSHKRRGDEYDGYLMHGLQGAARYALLNMPEPVAAADADFNRAVTIGEFRGAAVQRFQVLDSKRLGRLALQDLEALVPSRPRHGQRPKEDADTPDARVGLPLPQSN